MDPTAGRQRPYDRPTLAALELIGLGSLAGSFVCALTYLVVLHAAHPDADQAAGDPLSRVLSDPFVVHIGGTWMLVSAITVFPVAALALRRMRIGPTFWAVLGATLLEIVMVTPFWGPLGWMLSYAVAVGAMITCRSMPQFQSASTAT
jgi:hypothetical protein